MTEITTIMNQKGGTGKTTTAVNLGAALAALGRRVMLIDLDPQANLSYSFGINDPAVTIADVLEGSVRLREALVTVENLWVAPATVNLADTEISLIDAPHREAYLREALQAVVGIDHILIDSPPSLSVLTLNALNASDNILIPLQMEVLSLRGLFQLLATVEEFSAVFAKPLPIKGIVAVRYDQRNKLSHEVFSLMGQNTQEYIFQTRIRENVRIAEAPSHAQSILQYAPASNGAKDHLALAEEFLRRGFQ